jgi:clathrin heavy chain
VALELAWRNGYFDYAMPYIIQYMRHLHEKVGVLEERTKPNKDEVVEDASAAAAAVMGGLMFDTPLLTNGPALLSTCTCTIIMFL